MSLVPPLTSSSLSEREEIRVCPTKVFVCHHAVWTTDSRFPDDSFNVAFSFVMPSGVHLTALGVCQEGRIAGSRDVELMAGKSTGASSKIISADSRYDIDRAEFDDEPYWQPSDQKVLSKIIQDVEWLDYRNSGEPGDVYSIDVTARSAARLSALAAEPALWLSVAKIPVLKQIGDLRWLQDSDPAVAPPWRTLLPPDLCSRMESVALLARPLAAHRSRKSAVVI